MIPVVKDITAVESKEEEMKQVGCIARGEGGIPFRRFFREDSGSVRMCNIHVFEDGNPEIERHLSFRNYLRANENSRNEYEKLKRALAEKYPDNMMKYAEGKNDFMESIERLNGFDKCRLVYPYSKLQIEGFNRIVENLLKPICDIFAYKLPSESSSSRHNFVYFKGVKVIGVASVQLVDDGHTAILRFLAIDHLFQKKGFGKQLLSLIEKWVYQQKRKILYLHVQSDAAPHLLNLGYNLMDFDDKEFKDALSANIFIDMGKKFVNNVA